MDVLVERCVGIDIGKDAVVACVRPQDLCDRADEAAAVPAHQRSQQ